MAKEDIITAGSIYDYFKKYYINTLNNNIVWYDDSTIPVVYQRRGNPNTGDKVFPSSILHGSSTYRTDPYPGSLIDDTFSGSIIGAQSIVDFLKAEAVEYTRIRNLKATFTVTGPGGNTGVFNPADNNTTRTETTFYNETKRALLTAQSGDFAEIVASSPMTKDRIIYWEDVDDTVVYLLLGWVNNITNNLSEYNTRICHASCHSACHRSRGRR